jgi:hypothetical protein
VFNILSEIDSEWKKRRVKGGRKCEQLGKRRDLTPGQVARAGVETGVRVIALQTSADQSHIQDKLIRQAELWATDPVVFIPMRLALAKPIIEAAAMVGNGSVYDGSQILLASALTSFRRDGCVHVGNCAQVPADAYCKSQRESPRTPALLNELTRPTMLSRQLPLQHGQCGSSWWTAERRG